MKKQVAKTISILSLFVMLSVSASNVSAGGAGCPSCTNRGPWGQYAMSGPAQTTSSASVLSAQDAGPVPTQDTTAVDSQPVEDVSFIALFWTRLMVFFASQL